jgi:hypothetical protein
LITARRKAFVVLQFLDAWGIIAQDSVRSDRIEMRFLSSSVCARVFDTTWPLSGWLVRFYKLRIR